MDRDAWITAAGSLREMDDLAERSATLEQLVDGYKTIASALDEMTAAHEDLAAKYSNLVDENRRLYLKVVEEVDEEMELDDEPEGDPYEELFDEEGELK